MSCRIATVQAEALPGAIGRNVDRAADLVQRAAAAGADLVVFPEAFVTGYDHAVFAGSLPSLVRPQWLTPVREAVDATGVSAVINTALDHDGRRTLTDVLLAPGREPLAAYDKQHVHANEREFFAAGTHGFSFTVNDVEIALSVCYDANLPEHAAAAAAAGAMVYVNSGAYFPGGARRRDLHHAARALDNGMYVVFSGLLGVPSAFIGGSAIFDPLGRSIAAVTGSSEGIAVADVYPAVVDSARAEQTMWRDRRNDLGAYVYDDAPITTSPRK